MAFDDTESESDRAPSPSPSSSGPLPPRVERALAEARASAERAGPRPPRSASTSARWLALVPVSVAALTMLLMMPRAVPPEEIPLPVIDAEALDRVRRDDLDRAARARAIRLPSAVLLVGTSLRALNANLVSNAGDEDVSATRTALEHAVRTVMLDGEEGFDGLRSLRAVQLDTFLAAVEAFESTGVVSEELEAVGGAFLDRMHAAGWLDGNRVVLDDRERRAAYKLVWTAQIGAERMPQLELTLDEQRALYTLYLRRPHAPEAQRVLRASQRASATSDVACQRAVAQERVAIEQWRLEKIKRLGALDPAYPSAYALGVAYYRIGRYDASVESFRSWIDRHPDGALSLRARNHLKAALVAYGPS